MNNYKHSILFCVHDKSVILYKNGMRLGEITDPQELSSKFTQESEISDDLLESITDEVMLYTEILNVAIAEIQTK